MSPAKYGIISIIFLAIDQFKVYAKCEYRRNPDPDESTIFFFSVKIEEFGKDEW